MKKRAIISLIVMLIYPFVSFSTPQYGEFVDPRDGQRYKTVIIDGREWFAENLNYEAPERNFCYDDKAENGELYGRLYDERIVKDVIPEGWHLPTAEEWDALIEAAGGEDICAKSLKSSSGWLGTGSGTDAIGFNALPSGHRYLLDSYELGESACWWAGALDSTPTHRRKICYDNDYMYDHKLRKFKCYSIRCVRDYQVESDKFIGTAESLKAYKCPVWFRDAKFGIYTMFGLFCVPEFDDWYGRYMYEEGSFTYRHHVKKYGHPSEFGYKDFIDIWEVDKFDPDALMKLFKKAGARYFASCAVHHDNFDLWNSTHHRWNSVEMGPKIDIVGEFKEAAERYDMRFGVTTHLARSYTWFNTANSADTKGAFKGVPYDALAGEGVGLYPPADGQSCTIYAAESTDRWREEWYNRLAQLIDDYDPDIFYFDSAIPFQGDSGESGLKLMAHYYNEQPDGFMTYKLRKSGVIIKGVSSIGHERSGVKQIEEEPWQTDDSIGPWVYKEGGDYAEADLIIDKLIDIVSKNGNLMLCVPLRADGSIDRAERKLLEDIGSWMDVNGEAIYETRPWVVFGEGDTVIPSSVKKSPMISSDIRFTQKDNSLYMFLLDWPKEDNEIFVESLTPELFDATTVTNIAILGSSSKVEIRQEESGTHLKLPKRVSGQYAHVIKFDFE